MNKVDIYISFGRKFFSELSKYIVQFYVTLESRFPPSLWVTVSALNCNKGPEFLHSYFNEQFDDTRPSICLRNEKNPGILEILPNAMRPFQESRLIIIKVVPRSVNELKN
jgi:hypothetical protein